MTPEEFKKKMREIYPEGLKYNDIDSLPDDFDVADHHIQADRLMMNLLATLGYSDGVQIFDSGLQWYA